MGEENILTKGWVTFETVHIDASVIPIQITGHTNAPTIAIAEKAADLIKS